MLAGLVLALILAADARVRAVDPDPAVKKTFDKLLDAVKANDKDAFVACETTDNAADAMGRARFAGGLEQRDCNASGTA